jgi:hypothetical protein
LGGSGENKIEYFVDRVEGLHNGFDGVGIVGLDIGPGVAGGIAQAIDLHEHAGGEFGDGLLAGVGKNIGRLGLSRNGTVQLLQSSDSSFGR